MSVTRVKHGIGGETIIHDSDGKSGAAGQQEGVASDKAAKQITADKSGNACVVKNPA